MASVRNNFSFFNKGFNSSEHVFLGHITLRGLPKSVRTFILPNGATVTFGEILALAGDYYGILTPISSGKTVAERRKYFMAAYDKLAKASPEAVNLILNNIKSEDKLICDALLHGNPSREAFQRVNLKRMLNYFKTAEASHVQLAQYNIDHFGSEAVLVFQTGFEIAMEEAVKAAYITNDILKTEQLCYAYSLLAYACHYLTDLFASGHMRTPRAALNAEFGPIVGSLLAMFQHDEDNDLGLQVFTNVNGKYETWRAFGDGHLHAEYNNQNRRKVLSIVKCAANEIFKAYKQQRILSVDEQITFKLIPAVTENNTFPLFKLEDNKLVYRMECSFTDEIIYDSLNKYTVINLLLKYSHQYVSEIIQERIREAIDSLEQRRTMNCAIL
jgi:hypothetical protein